MTRFWKVLLGSALYVLDSLEQPSHTVRRVRERARDRFDDEVGHAREIAEQRYETAAERLSNVSRALRGEDNHALANALRFAGGLGIGIGLGLLLAPAPGDQTRSAITGKARDFGQRVKEHFGASSIPATGTDG